MTYADAYDVRIREDHQYHDDWVDGCPYCEVEVEDAVQAFDDLGIGNIVQNRLASWTARCLGEI